MRSRLSADRATWALFAVGQAAALSYLFLSDVHLLGPVWYLAVSALGVGMTVAAVVRHWRRGRRVWLALSLGALLFLAGDVLWTLYDIVWFVDPFPSLADVLYLSAYPVLAVGLAWLVRGRQPRGDRTALLDAAIFTTGLGVLVGVEVILPALTDSSASTMSRLVSSAYPLGDLVLLAVVARLAVTPGRRLPAFWALGTTVAAVLVTDAAYNVLIILGGDGVSPWLDLGWMQMYLLLGLAALHRTAPMLTDVVPRRDESLGRVRLLLLGASAVLAPGTLLLQAWRGQTLYPVFIGLGSIVLFLLVVMRVAGLLRTVQSQSVLLAELARSDALTGLPNRGTWDHELARLTDDAREQGTELTVVLLDLDHFKLYNDTRGHLAGDRLLRELASVWRSCLAGRGFLARYGGEEFALVVPGMPSPEVEEMVRSLRRLVPDGQSASAGVAAWQADEPTPDLMSRVDSALYAAKRAGRDTFRVASAEIDRPDTGTRPGRALRPRAVFQPIVELATGRVVAVEALSRFDRSALPPDEVFARAWLRGQGPALEAAAIRAALDVWRYVDDLPIHLNVSARALVTPELGRSLPRDLRSVVLEITEQDVSSDSTQTDDVLDALRRRGATLAIDDFGVGFSNLRRMVGLRPEIIKLDRSLVSGVQHDLGRRSVIAAVAEQARLTGRVVCAEGVETEAELRTLRDLGVQQGQGYLFSPPVSPVEALRLCRVPAGLYPAVRRGSSVDAQEGVSAR